MKLLAGLRAALLTVGLVGTSAPARASNEDPILKDDRLSAQVTLYRESILLADLLRLLSDRTGVPLRVNPRDPELGTVELAIGLPGQPVGSVLADIPSLYRGIGQWRWDGKGTAASPYTLVCDPPVSQLAGRAGGQLEADFQQYAALMFQLAAMGPAERDQFLGKHPELTLRRRPSEETLLGIKAIGELPMDLRHAVLEGQQVRMRFDQLPASGQELVRTRWAHAQALNPNNPAYAGGPPQDILITRDTRGGWITPVVVIQPGRLGADGYVGGGNLEELVKRRDEKAFLSDADSTELPDGEEKGEVKVPLSTFPAGTPLAGKSAPAGMLPGRMVKWLSLKFKAPILSNLAARRDGTIGIAQFHRSLREHLTAIASSFPVSMKQRKGILLIQDRSWFTEPTFGTTPFEVVERLRKTFKDTEPSLDVVLRGLSETSGLPEGGCQFLARYFPIAALGDRTAAGLLAYGEQREKKRAGLDQGQAVELSTLSLVSRRRLEALGERDHNAPRFVAGGSLQFQFSAGSDYVRFGYVLKSPSEECKSLPLLRRRTGTAPFLMLPPETDEIVDSRQ